MAKKTVTKHLPRGVNIAYEDRDIIVVSKPVGLLTIATKDIKENNLYFVITDYVKKGNSKSPKRIYLIHRLDRDTSGLVIFAKTKLAQDRLRDNWEKVEQKYLAVVHDIPEKNSAVLKNLLAANKIHRMYVTKNEEEGKEAITKYQVLKSKKEITLMEIQQFTNLKHQIRVQLAEIEHPILGDKKYAVDRRGHKELVLHAYKLTFPHPYNGKEMTVQAQLPEYFEKLVRGSVKKYSPKPEKKEKPEVKQKPKTEVKEESTK